MKSKILFCDKIPGRRVLPALILCILSIFAVFGNTAYADEEIRIGCTVHERKSLAITIYNGGPAYVKEVRRISLPTGNLQMTCTGFPKTLIPSTLWLRSITIPGSLAMLDQHYQRGVTVPGELLQNYIGRRILLVESNENSFEEKRTEAVLLSTEAGNIYRIGNDIYLGHPGKVVLPEVRKPLVTEPTLTWLLHVSEAASHDLELSYLADGLSWTADYHVLVDREGENASVNGGISVDNQSGYDFQNAELTVVAGEQERIQEERRQVRSALNAKAMRTAAVPEQTVEAEPLFEYHLYRLPRPVMIHANTPGKFSFLAVKDVPIRQELIFRSQRMWGSGLGYEDRARKADVEIVFRNDDNGPGKPLPAGVIRMYKDTADQGSQFIGETALDHTPVGKEVRLKAGKAFDVEMERKQMAVEKLGPRVSQEKWEITIKNYKTKDVTVTLVEPMYGEWKIVNSNRTWKRLDAGSIEFEVPVSEGGVSVVSYTVVFET